MVKVEEGRQSRDGLTVRCCEYRGVDWEATMLDCGAGDHGRFRAGLGDWTGRIRSGETQPARELPPDSAVPALLREIGAARGYLGASSRA